MHGEANSYMNVGVKQIANREANDAQGSAASLKKNYDAHVLKRR